MVDDPARKAILARRAKFVSAAMLGLAVSCSKKEAEPEPCLKHGIERDDGAPRACLDPKEAPDAQTLIVDTGPDAGSDADSDVGDADADADADAPAPPKPCLKIAPPHPCLSPPPPKPCLKMAPPGDL